MMKLAEYLDGMRAATTAEELEAAIQGDFKHSFRGPTWTKICNVRTERGREIVAAHKLGRYVPTFGERRALTVCGETYKVGRGQNSTGVRYVWHAAGVWAIDVLMRNGFSRKAANMLWESGWRDYPHRCLSLVAAILDGKHPDPVLNVLIRHERTDYGQPICYTVEQNNADKWDYRANRPCECGGTLFDWGAGHSYGFEYVNWHCNKCPDVFTEYMTREQMYELRAVAREARLPPLSAA